MRLILELLMPVFLLIALGAALQRGGFFGAGVVTGLNRLSYWVALPALIFSGLANASDSAADTRTGYLLAVMMGTTVLVAGLGWLIAGLLGMPWSGRGTFTQAFFRGNLAFVALPILLHLPGVPPTVVMLMLAPMMLLYNVLSVTALVASREGVRLGAGRALAAEWIRNPIILASVAGGLCHWQGWSLPTVLDGTLGQLGKMAVPLALVTIGAVLLTLPIGAAQSRAWAVGAVAGKVVISPLVGVAVAWGLGLAGVERTVLLVLLACPTAVISYSMAGQLGGDEGLAAQVVVGSTLASAASLGLILALAS
jgi:predicted permease